MNPLGLRLLLNKLYLLTYTLLYSSQQVALTDQYQQCVTQARVKVCSNSLVQLATTCIRIVLMQIQSALPFVFADDTKCLLAIKSTEDVGKLQSDVNNTAMWSHSTDLLFNEAKFVHVFLG